MTLRVAIIGAGPAGIYAAEILLKHEEVSDVSIDLFEGLPAPYGLVRYGVAPDHPRIKGIVNSLREILDAGKIRFFGNVNYGTDITLDDLKQHYHAVIFATGAMRDAKLDIPGIDLPGSFGAADFVSWYNGHPDVPREWPLDAKEVAIIGNGNVALDIARMLVKRPDDLYPTEVPDNVFNALEASQVTDVHVFGRRSPLHVKFTPLELRELGELEDVDIVLSDEDFDFDDALRESIAAKKQLTVIERIFRDWRERKVRNAARRVHLHFFSQPLEVLGAETVEGLRCKRIGLKASADNRSPVEIRSYQLQAVYRAVGYFGSPLAGIAFDSKSGVVPNFRGAVLDAEGVREHGVFVTGWIKRGPVGLIGHTKSDAIETVNTLLEMRDSWWNPFDPDPNAITSLLMERGCEFTGLAGWHRLDLEEVKRGEVRGKERLKVVSRQEMLALSNS
jgi:ferredoxin--NADP+ reductase